MVKPFLERYLDGKVTLSLSTYERGEYVGMRDHEVPLRENFLVYGSKLLDLNELASEGYELIAVSSESGFDFVVY